MLVYGGRFPIRHHFQASGKTCIEAQKGIINIECYGGYLWYYSFMNVNLYITQIIQSLHPNENILHVHLYNVKNILHVHLYNVKNILHVHLYNVKRLSIFCKRLQY